MKKASITSAMNLKPLLDQIERLEHLPDERTVEKLDRTLAGAFAVTQEHVHIWSGRLKASGRTRSWSYGDEWGGAITYGGGEAYYAPWEFSREGHDPFHDDPNLTAYEEHFEQVVRDAING